MDSAVSSTTSTTAIIVANDTTRGNAAYLSTLK